MGSTTARIPSNFHSAIFKTFGEGPEPPNKPTKSESEVEGQAEQSEIKVVKGGLNPVRSNHLIPHPYRFYHV
ncbi:hypothetical protein PM082_001827 [Marasmius tenuissimus]|nr:hypothetical protein PM082_001827 [Marasmius tenuissimus]